MTARGRSFERTSGGKSVTVPELMVSCLGDRACAVAPDFGCRPLALDGAVRALRFHGVLATLAPQLRQIPGVPVDLLAAADLARRQQAMRSLQAAADLRVLRRCLAAAGVPWLVVKGPAVARSLYPEASLREYSDIDVLVPPKRMADTLEALVGAGACLVDRNWPLIASGLRGELSLLLPHGSSLDLHWSLINDPANRRRVDLPAGDVFGQARVLGEGVDAIPALSAEDQLVHLAVHAFNSSGRKLYWLKDLQLAAAAAPDWDVVLTRAASWHADTAVAAMLLRTADLIGADVPPRVLHVLGPLWRSVLRLAVKGAPPERSHEDDHRSGSEVLWATRATSWSSLRALAQGLAARRRPETLASQLPDQHETTANPLHVDVPDVDARRRWLAAICS